MKPKTAHEKIKAFLLRGNSITPRQSWNFFSCYRLSSVIHRLRKEGMKIKTIIHCVGKTYSYAEYKLQRIKK